VERVVGLELRDRLVRDVVRRQWVLDRGSKCLGSQSSYERLLPFDAVEVGSVQSRRLPLSVDQLLHVAGPDVTQRVHTVEEVATRSEATAAAGVEVTTSAKRCELEAALLVAGGGLEVYANSSHRVHDALEAREVDLEVVMDRDVEVRVEGVHDPLGTLVERRIDLRLSETRDVDDEVARKGHQKAGLGARIDVHDHESVR